MSTPPDHPTLLRTPGAPGRMPCEMPLDLWVSAYRVEQTGHNEWTVSIVGTRRVLYQGPGPIEFLVSPAPF
ncbi:hypothetical protein [Acidovorax sp. Leaf84]|uniref:hypothetical protein n=1 Tax=Acidovorax sp. Leaf84 TaxID=1736240 RepID=UPI000AD4393A|nr:hypothetical protein [Acidovorax sp. Leaf84]